ncbi:MAG: DUF5667 domain-containing protein [Candidatus Saccharimonadales bacterium]|nr:DUF5667 domain-containing protein [Candidatus Saccharimonadales bacterium]
MKSNQSGFAHLLLIAAAVFVVGGTGTAVASNSARPGDLLYGLDRGMENIRGALTFGEEAKAHYYAKQSQERKGEINSLLNGNASEDRLDQAVRNYGETMDKALSKANGLSGEAKEEALSSIAEKSLVHQDNFLEMAEGSGERYQNQLENAFTKANQNFGESSQQLSEAKLEQVMNQARNQVRNLDGLMEQIQLRSQDKEQENKPEDSGNKNEDTGNQSDNKQSGSDDSNKPEETGGSSGQGGSGGSGGN